MKNISRTQSSSPSFAKLKVLPALKSVKDPGNTFSLAKGGQELYRL
jgi:hypothetical protein